MKDNYESNNETMKSMNFTVIREEEDENDRTEDYESDGGYESNDTVMGNDLEELLAWLKTEVMNAPTSIITEQGKKSSSEFSQRVDAYDKIFKLYQAELDRDLDERFKTLDAKRKNCEYLEDVARKTKELELKAKELELKEKELELRTKAIDADTDIKNREINVKERDVSVKELSAEKDGRWWISIIPQAMSCGTVLLVNMVGLRLNASETPIKSIFEKWMIKPNVRL